MVLHRLEVTDGHEVAERLLACLGLWWWRCHEIVNDGIGRLRRRWVPAQQCVPCPSRHVHEPVDLRDYLSLELPDGSEHGSVAPYQLLVRPFVGLGDPEVDGHDHALMWPPPRPQGRSRR